ncbi:hypothetical protein TNCV_4913851 [Trichonephila clavipes]|nr:hypothetical protein TNCV_4913851 [Trichonephila clavipes]
MRDGMMKKWARQFNDEALSGWLSIVNDGLVEKVVSEKIRFQECDEDIENWMAIDAEDSMDIKCEMMTRLCFYASRIRSCRRLNG